MSHQYAVASASWPDHLVFGVGDGAHDTVGAIERRFAVWREKLDTRIVHWREVRTRRDLSHYYSSPDNPRTQEKAIRSVEWDDFEVVPRVAHDNGMKALLYVSVFDDGRGLLTDEERKVSFHNAMHGQHVTWQTDWSRAHPDFATVDRTGGLRQWGVFSYAHPEVRTHMADRIDAMVEGSDFDGVFICTRSQCRPSEYGDQFGFDEATRVDMLEATDRDILREDFDLDAWRRLHGSYFTTFLEEVSQRLRARGMSLGVGLPRGDVIGPPLGNWELQWRRWVAEGIVDQIVVGQNSSQCPSMWHQLWPMHRGYGYLQNYIDGKGMPPLAEQVREVYSPVFVGSGVDLYIARQWDEPDERTEADLLAPPGVSGLVFSTFRYDNPEAVAKGDWVA
jgi:hypothetical protein